MAYMNRKKVIKLCLFVLIFLFLINLWRTTTTNVYKYFPKGTELSLDLLRKSTQIIMSDSDVILLMNISTRWDRAENYLLFFNSSNELYSASYLPSVRIDSVNKRLLYATSRHEENVDRITNITDLPRGYAIHLTKRLGTAGGWECNKIIDQLSLNKGIVKMVVRKSTDLYACGGWSTDADTSYFFKSFEEKDTFNYFLSELSIDYKKQLLLVQQRRDGDYRVLDRFVIVNKSNFDSLYYPLLENN